MRQLRSVQRSERGAALLSVLMIVAVMSVTALLTLDTLSRSVSLSKATADRSRSIWATRSLEDYAATMIEQLAETVGAGFSARSADALQPQTIPMPDGVITLRLEEETNCFNLNALGSMTNDEIDPVTIKTYHDLLVANDFSRFEAQALADTLVDWMDTDERARVNGAESVYYSALTPPYRTSGQMLENASELNAIAGYTPEIRDRIASLVCVRPSGSQSVLNVNTLTEDQAPLLMTLFSKELTRDDTISLIQSRPPGGWETMAEFNDLDIVKTITEDARNSKAVSLSTSHVRLKATYQTQAGAAQLEALFEWAANAPPKKIWRRYGGRS